MHLIGDQIDPSQVSQLLAETASITESGNWQRGMVWSVGAGIYEELLFRLIGVSVLYLLFVKIIGMKNTAGAALAVGICALLFAGYHFPSWETFNIPTFLFYTAAGIYLGVVCLSRGFGIAVTTHALYDVMVVLMTYQANG